MEDAYGLGGVILQIIVKEDLMGNFTYEEKN